MSAVLTVFSLGAQSWTDDFMWMDGIWIQEKDSIAERWEVTQFEVKGFVSRSVDSNELLELLEIKKTDGKIAYTAFLVKSNSGTTFKCTKNTSSEVVFENLKHDFPKVISYQRISMDQLLVTISGNGKIIEWKYFRY
jgi:hypothetical protein